MSDLSQLKDTSRPSKRRKRIGRGPSSGMGKTSTRGHKGAGSRSGYRRRHTYEGGRLRLFQSLPTRGFSRARFQRRHDTVNLWQIDRGFADGDEVTTGTLAARGLISGKRGVKLLGKGDITKKIVSVEVTALSTSAREKLEKAGIVIKPC